MKKYTREISTIVVIILVLLCLMLVSTYIPSSLIKENVRESAALIESEGMYPVFVQGTNSKGIVPIQDTNVHFFDNWSDALLLNIAYAEHDARGLTDIVSNYYHTADSEFPMLEGLKQYLAGNESSIAEYSRYWLGIVAFLRVLLIFINLGEIRWGLFVLGLFLLFAVLHKLHHKFGTYAAMAFLAAYILCGGVINNACLAYATDFIIMLSMMLIVMKEDKKYADWFYWGMTGFLTFFMNFWSMPLMTLGCPLVVVCLKNILDKKGCFRNFKNLLMNSLVWLVGFLFAIGSKQLVCLLFLQSDTGIQHMAYWGGEGVSLLDRLVLTAVCVGRYIGERMNFITLFTVMCVFIIGTIYHKTWKSCFAKGYHLLLMVSFYPIVWYFLLATHTRHGFDKLQLMVSVFAILIFFQPTAEKMNWSRLIRK